MSPLWQLASYWFEERISGVNGKCDNVDSGGFCMGVTAPGFTAHVAEEVVGMSFDDLSESQIERTKHIVLDWLTVAIAGAGETSATTAHRLALEDGCAQVATIVGTSHRTSVGHAAFANALAAHALDYDDTSWWTGGHPGAGVIAAAIALGESLDVDGRSLIESVVAGLQGEARIYLAGHPASGFDPSAVYNAFGGAGACARLLGLDADTTARMYSLVATQTAGLMFGLGTMATHVSAGHAADVAVTSARLAAGGVSAATDGLEAAEGFMASHGATLDTERSSQVMENRLTVENVSFKRHACAGGTHSAIDGVLRLRGANDFSFAQVREVRLVTAQDMAHVCGVIEPSTGLEAKFSMRYGAALALGGFDTGPGSFTDEFVSDPRVAEIMRRVVMIPDSDQPVAMMRVEIELNDGTQVSTDVGPVFSPVSDDELETEWGDLVAKCETLATPIIGRDAVAALVDAVASLETVASIRELLAHAAVR